MHSKGAGGAEFDYRQAQYGPGIIEVAGTAPYGMTVADPLDGCDDKAYKVSCVPSMRAQDTPTHPWTTLGRRQCTSAALNALWIL